MVAPMPLFRSLRRHTSVVAAALALVASVACGDDSNSPGELTPTFTGLWAGQPWAGQASALLIPGGGAGDTLYVFGAHRVPGQDWTDQYLRIRAVVQAPGTYELGADDAGFEHLLGGDVITAAYAGSRPDKGILNITMYEGPGGIVEGTVTFGAESTSRYAPYGPHVRFEDGWFRATIPLPR